MHNGLEVDMLNVGDADCLLVTRWQNGTASRVLIDGANATDYPKIKIFLKNLGIDYLNAVVCTHMHKDHAAGLIELAKDKNIGIGKAYMHYPQQHLQMALVERALKATSGSPEAESIQKTLQTADDLLAAFNARQGLSVYEPFQGTEVEFLTVVGPSKAYYEELVAQFQDAEALKRIDQGNLSRLLDDLIEEKLGGDDLITAALSDDPQTTPENNSSAILATVSNDLKHLFTSDAGAPALKLATDAYDLRNCSWVQIPHHGSHRNITASLIQHFAPQVAFVSASGSVKHPRRSVVNAFKQVEAKVYSTHYPYGADLRRFCGSVPERAGYGPAIALYEKDEVKKSNAPAVLPNSLYGMLYGLKPKL